jgi:hypothetical protein
MCNHTADKKDIVITAHTLAIALLTIDMGVNSAWAGSDRSSGLNNTPVSSEGVYRSGTKADKARRFTQACMQYHEECTPYPDMRYPCCDPNQICDINPTANGRHWCNTPVQGACMHLNEECSWPPAEGSRCCAGDQVCRPNPNSNGGNWCVGDVQ